MCVRPRAPPPDSTTPILGRFAGAGGEAAIAGIAAVPAGRSCAWPVDAPATAAPNAAAAIARAQSPSCGIRVPRALFARCGNGCAARCRQRACARRNVRMNPGGQTWRKSARLYRPTSRYTRTAIALHWLALLLIVLRIRARLVDGGPSDRAADAPDLRLSQMDRHHGVPADARPARLALHAPRASAGDAPVAATRGSGVACASLCVDARDSAVRMDLQFGHRSAGRVPRRLRASRSRAEGQGAGRRPQDSTLRR